MLAADPADLRALDRLARITETEGKAEEAAEVLRRKADIERIRARYEKLFDRKQPARDAEEMADLAVQLGRRFEARAFLTLAISEDPDRDDLRHDLSRLPKGRAAVGKPGQTLAEIAVDELGTRQKNEVTRPR